jgi:hypothetical protein
MAEYVTLKAICARMGWKKATTAIRKVRNEAFLMYRDTRGRPPRLRWVTNDELINLWQVGRCQASRTHIIETGKYQEKPRNGKTRAVVDGQRQAGGDVQEMTAASPEGRRPYTRS